MTVWLRVLMLGWMLWAGAAQAEPLAWGGNPAAGQVLFDASGQWSPDEAARRFDAGEGRVYDEREFHPLTPATAVWFRLDVPPTRGGAVLNIPHPGLNRVDLYFRDEDGDWIEAHSGDSLPVAEWALRHLHPAFDVPTSVDEGERVWVRVQHNYALTLPWRVWSRADFDTSNQHLLLLLGAYLGFVLLVMGVSLFNWLAWRDRLYLTNAFYVASIGAAQISLTGVGGMFVWPHHAALNDYASAVLPVIGLTMAGWFTYRVVAERSSRIWRIALLGYCVIGVCIALAFLVADRNLIFRAVNLYFLICTPLCIAAMAVYARRNPRVGWWFVAGFAVLFIGSMFTVLRNLSILPMSTITQFGVQIAAALELPLLMAGLHFRSRERRANQLRMSRLGHVDPLTGLSNHRVLVERLAQQLQRGGADVAVLRIRVGNAHQISDEYGEDVLETAMVHAGACIGRVARESDTVARHRNGDFVLLLGSQPTREEAGDAAQRIIARGLAHTSDLPEQQSLRLLVAAVVPPLPFDESDSEELLDSLGALLDELQARPGKALRFLE